MRKATKVLMIVFLLLALSIFYVFGVSHTNPNLGPIINSPGVTIPPNFSGNYSKENYTLVLTNFKTLYADLNQSIISISSVKTAAYANGLIVGIFAGLFIGFVSGAVIEGSRRKNKPT